MSQLSLSMNDILKDAQRIHEFRGDDVYALSSFLREVDTILSLIQSDEGAREYVYRRIVLNKIQGEALHVVRTLGSNPDWKETKMALINNFGVRDSYHQLYQEAFGAHNSNIVNYYKKLRSILCKLNEKYEFDEEKPLEFSPISVEKIILKTFLNNIDINLASVVINRKLDKLRDAYNFLEQEGLIRNNDQKYSIRNHDKKNDVTYNSTNNVYRNNVNNYKPNNAHSGLSQNNRITGVGADNFNRPTTSTQTRQYYRSDNQPQFRRSGQFRVQDKYNRGPVENIEMEVDYIQADENSAENVEQVNFHITASRRHFQ